MKIKPAAFIGGLLFGLALSLLVVASARTQAAAPTNTSQYALPAIAPGDWPMYGHDYQRTNFNPDETTISESNINQLAFAWNQNIAPAHTNTPPSSAPSVSGGKVFVGSNATTGSNFFAFDATSGALSWSDSLTFTSRCFNVGIGSTAAISGTLLSVGGSDSAFYGIDTTNGHILWRNPMNLGSSAYPWESPLLAYGRSYLGMASDCDNPSVRGEVRAVDEDTGTALVSQYFVPAGQAGAGVWNSPALSPDGSKLFVVTGEDYNNYNGPYNRAMISLDPISLQILQSFQEGPTRQDADFGTTPVVFHDSQGRTLVGANHKNGVFYTFDIDNIDQGPVWMRSTGTSVGAMPAYDPTFGNGGTLFINGSGGSLWAVDPANGSNRWAIGSVVAGVSGNLAIANGLLFVNAGNSGLKIYRESDGTLLRTIVPQNNGDSNSGVAVSNGFVYWQSGNYLHAYNIAGTPGPTNTPTNTPAITATRTPSPTGTATFTSTPSRTPTGQPTSTSTPTGQATATRTPTSPAATATRTNTPQPTVTGTHSPVATATNTDTPQATFTTGPTSTPCTMTFSDVQPSDYFYEAVTYLACHGAISGYSDGSFRPYNNTTRGQLSKIVVLAVGWTIDTTGGPHFSDVPENNPFYPYIETAYNHGVITGYADGTFRWGNNITRGQLSKVVVLAMQWDIDTSGGPHFSDVPETDPFYGYIETAFNHSIISGYSDGTFRPGNNATRGQIAKIVYLAVTNP